MKLEKEIYKYLQGEEFSNSLTLDITREKIIPATRENAILNIIKGSDVIHLGCADHVGIIDEKIQSGRWLHKLITDNSKSCFGIDISSGGIAYMKDKLGYSNVKQADVVTDTIEEISSKNWDWVVFGELIEHLDNPVEFLSTFKKRFGPVIKRFLITVPSVYTALQCRNIKNYREVINSDHRFWFTPYTICRLLVSAGYSPESIDFANLQSLDKLSLVIRKLRKLAGMKIGYPYYYFNTIIITGTLE